MATKDDQNKKRELLIFARKERRSAALPRQ